jgi:hypothetical protein
VKRFVLLGLATAPLLGCGQAADLTGAVAGGTAALVSANPAVGYGVGIGVRAATSAGIRYAVRRRQQAAQDEVAAVIGSLAPGETRAWRIRHDIPIGNERGEVRLVRVLDNALAPCREALFSVAEGSAPDAPRQWFLTTACRQRDQAGDRWKWAAAEPATARWGSLQ